MKIEYGDGGWIRATRDEWPGDLLVRLEPDERGRWTTRELYLRGDKRRVSGADLRGLDIAEVEDFAQMNMEALEQRARVAAPDLPWQDMLLNMEFREHRLAWVKMAPLRRPTHGLTDDFLRHVKLAYMDAVEDGLAPAPELARQAGCSVRTVHDWVSKARQRGIMPPASRLGRSSEGSLSLSGSAVPSPTEADE